MYNQEGILPEEEAYLFYKEANSLPWHLVLAKHLARARQMARTTAAGVNFLTTPWGQGDVVQGPTNPSSELDELF